MVMRRSSEQCMVVCAGKGFTSMTHYNLVHEFIPMPQPMKIPDAKATVDKEWKKLETNRAWNLDKVKSKKRMHPDCAKFPNPNFHETNKWPKSLGKIEDPEVPLERNEDGHPLAESPWERQFEQALLELG